MDPPQTRFFHLLNMRTKMMLPGTLEMVLYLATVALADRSSVFVASDTGAITIPAETNSNDFGVLGNLLADSNSNFVVAKIIFFERFEFLVFKVQSHTMWPYMCLCCGLFVTTQFQFECCGVRDSLHRRRRRRASWRQRCGAGWSPVLAGPKVVSASHDESQRQGTFGVVATCMCDHSSCFDQTYGCPGEGPLTLGSPDAQGMCLTPTQEFTTCDMINRKTQEKRGPHVICRACGEHPRTPTQWTEMQEMPYLGMQHGRRKRCRGFAMLPHVRRCFA